MRKFAFYRNEKHRRTARFGERRSFACLEVEYADLR